MSDRSQSTLINLRHLQAYCEVVRLQSISAAARAVHLSQPAVTQAIAGVERYFGASLLTRSAQGVTATAAGVLCHERVQRALGQLRDGVADSIKRAPSSESLDVLRSLSVAHLDALAAVVEHRGFSAAARARGISQPVVHRAARALERLLGTALFERTSFGVTPTREAERLARRVRLAFHELAQAQAEIATLMGGASGTTVIGALPLARAHLLPTALIDFGAQYPEHRVAIVEGAYEHLLGALRRGEIDFLVGAMRDPKTLADVTQEHLFDDPLCIVVRAGHPLARRKRVSVATLRRFSWIAPRASSPLHAHFETLFEAAGVTPPRAAIECNSLAAARALLVESDRVMLLSAHQIYYDLRAGTLVTLPHPAGRITRAIGITYRNDWRPTRIQAQLLEFVKRRARPIEA